MAVSGTSSEHELVRAAIAGEAVAVDRLLAIVSPALYALVTRTEIGEAARRSTFFDLIDRLKADDFAALRAFDGRGSLKTYVVLLARNALADRVARDFAVAPDEAWPRFQRFFDPDIKRRIARRFPRDATTAKRDDVYQDVCLKLVENDYRRVRAYAGRGSFAGFVLRTVDRILIDFLRREAPRRRLPAAVARMPRLSQLTFAAIAWDGLPAEAMRIAEALKGRLDAEPSIDAVELAISETEDAVRIEATQPSKPDMIAFDGLSANGKDRLAADALNPEEHLLDAEEDRERSRIVEAVRAAAETLPAAERLYLKIVFSAADPMPAREIAQAMGCPVETVYRLKQTCKRWLAEVAGQMSGKPSVSVSDKNERHDAQAS